MTLSSSTDSTIFYHKPLQPFKFEVNLEVNQAKRSKFEKECQCVVYHNSHCPLQGCLFEELSCVFPLTVWCSVDVFEAKAWSL